MKLSINMLLWAANLDDGHLPLLPKLKAMGFDGVEVPVSGFDMAFYKRLSSALKNEGLECTMSMALPATGASFISENPAEKRGALDFMRKLFDVADIIGAGTIMGPFYQPLGVFSGKGPSEAEKARCLEGHAELAKIAEERKIVLALEVLNRFECYMFNTISQGAEHVEKISSPSLKLAYDTFHANIEEKDQLATVEKYFTHIAHVHVSENDRGIVGSGHVPIAQVMERLHSLGYGGWFTVEMFGNPLSALAATTCCWRPYFADALQACEDCARFLKETRAKILSK